MSLALKEESDVDLDMERINRCIVNEFHSHDRTEKRLYEAAVRIDFACHTLQSEVDLSGSRWTREGIARHVITIWYGDTADILDVPRFREILRLPPL